MWAGDGPWLDRPAAGRAPGREPAAAAGHDQDPPGGRRPDARGVEGDGRSRAADAPAVRPHGVGGRPVPRASARGEVAVSLGDEVVIAGRAFTLGTVYAPRPGSYGRNSKPRHLLRYTADSLLPGGRVTLAVVPSGNERVMAGTEWAAWAGEPVED